MKECFLQLAKFICLTDFCDVKYDNIPFLGDGSGIGLIDLNQSGAIGGLFVGGANKTLGLLNYAPTIEFLHEVGDEIKKH
jgi:hypothetical protein